LAMAKSDLAREGLLKGLDDPDPEIRALCAKGLGDAATSEDVRALAAHATDADVRVAVEVARALARLNSDDALDARPPTVLALGQAGVVPHGLKDKVSDPLLACRLAAAADRKEGVLRETLNCGLPEEERLVIGLNALADAPMVAQFEVIKYLDHPSARVKL